ncbi:mitochondrial inheritance GTPase, tubulin-like [Schizosaccharomyces osmophilus]|uniref:Mitochondrial inheritance GTPase, tubulin-like n=1 Tax=Schizosaccharomyces osmophilus TaxID=2545709 RepID=A0AAF0AWT0_9SCHI|nr:mitochondrial inheritance GTPase, tubulin-like [Schizosaccharomyces osmophilus]WBW73355.1 mitochondrial inheritance GTPase, tubulin-like [Schizosaccharomyces osmophilus]
MREILSLGFGSKSNYLLTHFWNTQEAYFVYDEKDASKVSVNTNFRQLTKHNREHLATVPRECVYDFTDEFGFVKKPWLAEERDSEIVGSSFPGSLDKIHKAPLDIHPYQNALWKQDEWLQSQNPHELKNLEQMPSIPNIENGTIKHWSDFNRLLFDPKYLYPINSLDLNSEGSSFELGEEAFRRHNNEQNVWDDSLRPLIEECDGMQGFQFVVDVNTGWSGFMTSYLQYIEDELQDAGLPVWIFGVKNTGGSSVNSLPTQNQKQMYANESLTLASLKDVLSLYAPLSLNSDHDHWFASSIANMAFESLTLPTRLNGASYMHMSDLEYYFKSNSGRSILALDLKAKSHEKNEWYINQNVSFATETPISLSNPLRRRTIMRGPNNQEAILGEISPELTQDIINIKDLGFPTLDTTPNDLSNIDTTIVSASSNEKVTSHLKSIGKYMSTRHIPELDQDDILELQENLQFFTS